MNIEELRRKLQAETDSSLNGFIDWVDDEIGNFLLSTKYVKGFPVGPTPNDFLSERAALLSDEELMFLWAVFKM